MSGRVPLPALAKVQTDDRLLRQLQDNVERSLAPVLGNPIAGGQLIESITLTAGTNRVEHRLGRKLKGWVLTRQRGEATPTKVLTDWEAWTPTGSWVANATYVGRKRRVGDGGQYQVQINLGGAPTAADLSINLPAAEVVDSAKLPSTGTTAHYLPLGTGGLVDTSAGNSTPLWAEYRNTTSILVRYSDPGSVGFLQSGVTVSNANPFPLASGDKLFLSFEVPIVGWDVSDSSFVQVYDAQDTEQLPDKFLQLVSSGSTVCDLYVF